MADPKSQRIEELKKQADELQTECKNLKSALDDSTEEAMNVIAEKTATIAMFERKMNAAEKLRDDWKNKCIVLQNQYDECEAHREALIEENNLLICEKNKLMDKLDSAERELEKANIVFKNELEKRSSLQRQYDEIKIKNQNICSTIADMVRKIMQE